MNLHVKKGYIKIGMYLGCMLLGSIFALVFYGTEMACIGILLALLLIGCYTRDPVSVFIFALFLPLNFYFMYIPVVFTGGKTFNAFINLFGFTGVLLLISALIYKRKDKLVIGSYKHFMFLYCMTSMIYYPLNSYINDVSVLSMAWRLAPLTYCVILLYCVEKKEKYMDEFAIVLFLSTVISAGVGYLELFRGKTFYYSL